MEYITNTENLELNIPFKAVYNNTPIIICKTTKGIFAVEDKCSHEEYPLSEGSIEDNTIECKKHGSQFDLESGKPRTLPALFPVKTYKVEIIDNKIFIANS